MNTTVNTTVQPSGQDDPIFERNLTGQSPSFVKGYSEALVEFGALRIRRLGTQLSAMTVECKALRREVDKGDPRRDYREGRRARVHDLYYGKLYRNPQFDLEEETRKISDNGRYVGVRGRIAYWAKGYRANTLAENGSKSETSDMASASTAPNESERGRKKTKKEPIRTSHGTHGTRR